MKMKLLPDNIELRENCIAAHYEIADSVSETDRKRLHKQMQKRVVEDIVRHLLGAGYILVTEERRPDRLSKTTRFTCWLFRKTPRLPK